MAPEMLHAGAALKPVGAQSESFVAVDRESPLLAVSVSSQPSQVAAVDRRRHLVGLADAQPG